MVSLAWINTMMKCSKNMTHKIIKLYITYVDTESRSGGEYFYKDLEIITINPFNGVFQCGGLHEVSVDKDGNVEDSYSHYYLCKEGEQEVKKEDKLS